MVQYSSIFKFKKIQNTQGNRSVIDSEWGWEESLMIKGHKGILGVIGLFYILIVVVT